jgi:hypothetical protein
MSVRRWRMILLAAPLVACASTASTATPERQAQIRAAADACLPAHPTVMRYDVTRFGQLNAWYRDNQGQTAATAPFFECVRARLGVAPSSPTAAPVAPVTGSAPTVTPASARPSRTADRLQELDALRQQRLIRRSIPMIQSAPSASTLRSKNVASTLTA